MKVLKIVLPAFFFMSLAFGADKFVDLPEGDHYIPSRLSYQNLAQVIDDNLDIVENVNITLVRRNLVLTPFKAISNGLTSGSDRFSFRVFFNASYGRTNPIRLLFACDLNITYKNIASEGYYLATEGNMVNCKYSTEVLRQMEILLFAGGFLTLPTLFAMNSISTVPFLMSMMLELGPEQLAELI